MNILITLWLPVVSWAGLIFFLSSMPGLSSGLELDTILRKVAHVIEYFILTFLLYRAFKGSFHLNRWSLFFYPFTISFFYAISDEIHQSFVPFRHGTITDVMIDSGGIACFYITLFLIPKLRQRLN